MKKIYKAPSTFSIELRATKMMALSYTEETIDSENISDFDQNAREENTDNDNNNRYSVWDNLW